MRPIHPNLRFKASILLPVIIVQLLNSVQAYAQNVGINNPTPHSKALLDLTASDKGLLSPRLTQAQRLAMFLAPDPTAAGMIVYQTDSPEGFYYFDGANWNLLSDNKSGWSLTGNSNTNPLINFIGTTDNQPWVIKTNNVEAARILPDGNIGIGTASPLQKLHVNGNVNLSNDSNNIRIGNIRAFSVKGSCNVFAGKYAGINTIADRNTFLGDSSGVVNTMGTANTGVGKNSLKSNTTGIWNAAVGTYTLEKNTFGEQNAAVGFQALAGNTEGSYNAALGATTLRDNTTGLANVAVGNAAGQTNTTGSMNVFLGADAGRNSLTAWYNTFTGVQAGMNSSGWHNTYIGSFSGATNTAGFHNTFLGSYSGNQNSEGSWNTFLGYNAGHSNSTGNSNIFIGVEAGYYSTTTSENTFIGHQAGKNSYGGMNTFIGTYSGINNNSGFNNTFVGKNSGNANTSGYENSFFGGFAGFHNIDGTDNTFIGRDAGVNNTSGSSNAFLGEVAGYNNNGNANTFIGQSAGSQNTSGSGNVAIGQNAQVGAMLNNAIAIGANANVTLNNSLVLGSTAVNVGIGTNAPASKLHIVSNNTGSPVRIQNQSNSNHSGIHFYSNSGTLMGQVGFANPGSGLLANTMYIGSIAGSPTVITTGDVERVRVDATGNVGIGTNAPTADLEINGFTKLGSTAPAIKTKKLAGTTAALQASQTIITHGIVTHTKILAVDLYIDNISGLSIPPDLTAISNNQYNYFISTSSIIINFINGNAAQIVNRPFRILITYEE